MTFAELKEGDFFDPRFINENVAFTQSQFYGELHKALGRKVRRFLIKEGERPSLFAQVIKFSLPFGKSFLYTPYGPVVEGEPSAELIKFAKESFNPVVREDKSIFMRFDSSFALGRKVSGVGASGYFQPREEWLLDLDKSEEETLTMMEKDHRYSIRTGEKKGVEVIFIDKVSEYFDKFYLLLSETGKRNKFGLLPKSYYKAIFDSLEKNQNGFLAIASFEEEVLAMNLIITHGDSAHYLLGSSASKLREKMPTYLLQWATIKHLKEKGIKKYNLGGVDVWESLAKYKKGFGGHTLNHGGMYDLVGEPLWYFLYKMRKMLNKR